jgi:hypothetical protein
MGFGHFTLVRLALGSIICLRPMAIIKKYIQIVRQYLKHKKDQHYDGSVVFYYLVTAFIISKGCSLDEVQ